MTKPDVDFVFGLSPVISIEQKTLANNPRSTVGTMTDIASYLNLLFATIGQPHCPRTGEPTPSRTSSQILEAILSLPEGAEIELRAPVFKVYGEELDFVFTEVRKKGCRRLIIDGKPVDISGAGRARRIDGPAHGRGRRPVRRQPEAREGDQGRHRRARCWSATGCCRSTSSRARARRRRERFYKGLCSPTHHFVYGDIGPEYFVFNNPESACRTCGGLGVDKLTHPELLVPDPKRSILGGCFVREAFKYNPDTWDGRVMYSLVEGAAVLARHALEGAAGDGAPRDPLRHRAEEDRADVAAGREGQARRSGRARRSASAASRGASSGYYRRYRQRGEANSGMEAWLDKVMVEHTCPDCNGARVRATRLLFTIARQDASTTSASSTSTSCTRSSARSSRPAAAPMPAGRC